MAPLPPFMERRIGSGLRGAGLSMASTPRSSTGTSWPAHGNAQAQAAATPRSSTGSAPSVPAQAATGYGTASASAGMRPPREPHNLSTAQEKRKSATNHRQEFMKGLKAAELEIHKDESEKCVFDGKPSPRSSQQASLPQAQLDLIAERTLGNLALRSPDAVDVAMRLVDLAGAKVKQSRFKDLYAAKAVALSGRLGRSGDFGSDKMINDFARVWEDQAFEDAVQCLCVAQGFARGQWNVATSMDYPGQAALTEGRFALHWDGLGKDTTL